MLAKLCRSLLKPVLLAANIWEVHLLSIESILITKEISLNTCWDLCAAHTATNPKDVTLPYLEEVMANMHEHPPSFDDLTDELRLLQKPLPLTPTCLNYFPQSPPTVNQLPQLVASTLVYPANSLAECVGAGLRSCADADDYSGEHSAIIATHFLVIGLMEAVLGFLGIPLRNHQSNTVEPCAAIAATKRPAAQLFMRSILMFKVRAAVRVHPSFILRLP